MILIWGIIGLIFGSAANAIIDRMPKNISWISGRSKCDHCGHTLAWKDLIPLLSWLLLGGKCRYCKKPISLRNVWVEIIMATGFMLIVGMHLPWTYIPIFWLSLVLGVMDWETQLVSEILILLWAFFVAVSGVSLVGVVASTALIGGLWLLTRGRGMGFGDVEIAAVMGLWLGWPNILVALLLAFIAGAIVGIMQILFGKSKMQSAIAFGPFLILGTWIALFWGDMIIHRLYG